MLRAVKPEARGKGMLRAVKPEARAEPEAQNEGMLVL
jgi:hypothetical protein